MAAELAGWAGMGSITSSAAVRAQGTAAVADAAIGHGRAAEDGIGQVGIAFDDGPAQVGVDEARTTEVGAGEVGAAEIRSPQVGAADVAAGAVQIAECVRTSQVAAADIRAFARYAGPSPPAVCCLGSGSPHALAISGFPLFSSPVVFLVLILVPVLGLPVLLPGR
jgi:hypothetical protein